MNGITLPDVSGNSSVVTVESLSIDYLDGFGYCGPNITAFVGIGTNNSGPNVNATTGQVWGTTTLATALVYASTTPITIRGADDIEPGFGSTGHTFNWIGGVTPEFSGHSSKNGLAGFQSSGLAYFDFGSADGCYTPSNPTSTSCVPDWTTYGIYDAAYGFAGAVAMPEDYCNSGCYPGMALDWEQVEHYGGSIPFSTVMTEWARDNSTFDPNTGWTDFTNTVAQFGVSSTDIGLT
jgi:hypothetical protein